LIKEVTGTLDFPLEMHGIISYLESRLPTSEKLELYWAGQFQSIELKEDTPWEPYSKKFAEREGAARAAWHVSAMQVTFPPPPNEGNHPDEVEEEDKNTSLFQQRSWNPVKRKHIALLLQAVGQCQGMPSSWLAEEETLATRLFAATRTSPLWMSTGTA
jgi:hypothetical protein